MRVAIASDHAGFEQKQLLAAYLAEDLAQDVLDLGPDSDDRVDYPDFANKVAHAVANGDAEYGVLVCGTGIGMALTADKVAGIRASSITTPEFAALFREHNDGSFVDLDVNKQIIKTFLATEFGGGRHQQRVDKIMANDNR